MNDLHKYLDKQMNNPAFRAEHEATRAEFEVARALIELHLQSYYFHTADACKRTRKRTVGQFPVTQQDFFSLCGTASQLPAEISISVQDRILTLSCYEIEIYLFLILGIQIGTVRRNITAHNRAVRRHHDPVALI